MRIGVGVSTLADSYEAARAAARDAKRAVPEPQLALVFGSIRRDHARLHAGALAELPAEIICGGSSYAEVTNAGVTKGSVAVLLLSLRGARVRCVDGDCAPGPEGAGRALGESLCRGLGARDGRTRPVGLYFGVAGHGRENELLAAMRARLPELPLFGGLLSTDYDLGLSHPDFWKSYQYQGGRLERRGTRLAVLDLPADEYRVSFGFEHGWSPVGPEDAFTRADGDRVLEVGGVPVFDYYRQFLGEQDSRLFFERLVQRYGFSMLIGSGESRRSVLKLPVRCDFDAGAITLYPAEDFAGKRVRLIQSSRAGLLEGARRAARACLDGLGGLKPALVLMVSCCTRSVILHSRVDAEVEAAREVFGRDTPIFGFYSGGEIFPFLNRYEEVIDPGRELSGSYYHVTTVGFMALGCAREPEAVSVPARAACALGGAEELARVRKLLAESEDIFDNTERFLANISRKSYRDGELLKSRNEELAERNARNERLQGVIHRYTPHDIWRKLGESAARGVYELADAAGEFAFLFLDVKGFTAYSEKHAAAEVVAAINRIFEPATELIYARGGDVDKFIGDCIFAAFPGPREAVAAGSAILELCRRLQGEGLPFTVRIGINAGRAVRANVGAAGRREYTYIGDAVNLAQRLEANCTPGRMLLSEGVYRAAGEAFPGAGRREITVKGKAEPVVVYEVG